MKKLYIVRHAKSDWSNLRISDFDRKLNDRGLKDAPKMGRVLLQKKITIDLIMSSTAIRAAQTTECIANEIKYDLKKISWIATLYHASVDEITNQIINVDEKFDNIMIVCHNPGITHFVNAQNGFITENVPTCGIILFEINTDNWKNFKESEKKILSFDFPKNYE